MKRFLQIASLSVLLTGCQTTPTCPPELPHKRAHLAGQHTELGQQQQRYAQLAQEHKSYAQALEGFDEHRGARNVHLLSERLYQLGIERTLMQIEEVEQRKKELESRYTGRMK